MLQHNIFSYVIFAYSINFNWKFMLLEAKFQRYRYDTRGKKSIFFLCLQIIVV